MPRAVIALQQRLRFEGYIPLDLRQDNMCNEWRQTKDSLQALELASIGQRQKLLAASPLIDFSLA